MDIRALVKKLKRSFQPLGRPTRVLNSRCRKAVYCRAACLGQVRLQLYVTITYWLGHFCAFVCLQVPVKPRTPIGRIWVTIIDTADFYYNLSAQYNFG